VGSYISIISTVDQTRPVRKGSSWMTTVIERIEGHYEVQEMSYGEAYVWCPESVVVEYDCGERLVLSTSETLCRCGIDHEVVIQEGLASRRPADRAAHPWDDEYHQWRKKHDEYLKVEHDDWLGWTTIE
jgi:hypothetical protein